MNTNQYAREVYKTKLDAQSKAILVYYGMCKNWKAGTFAFPSATKVALDTGLSLATVKRRLPELRAKGYLCDTGQRRGNGVIVYDLADPTSISVTPVQKPPASDRSRTSITLTPDQYHCDTEPVSERYTEVGSKKELKKKEQEQLPQPQAAAVVKEDSEDSTTSHGEELQNASHGEERSAGAPLTSPSEKSKMSTSAGASVDASLVEFHKMTPSQKKAHLDSVFPDPW